MFRGLRHLRPAVAATFVAGTTIGMGAPAPVLETHCSAERVPVGVKIEAMQARVAQMEAALEGQKQEPQITYKYPQRYAGKYALVTGGSKGIGRGICIRLAQEGAHVAIHYGRDKKGAEVTQQMINEELALMGLKPEEIAERTIIVGANASSEESILAMFDTYYKKWNRLDVLIPNHGIQIPHDSHNHPTKDFNKVINVNLTGYFICAREGLKQMLKQESGGCIVFDSSVHQIIPKPTYAGYAASKAAIGHLTSTLALEYADKNIRINCVGPGAIETPMNEAWTSDEKKKKEVCEHIPMGRPGTMEEIAAVFAFLGSKDAAYITGQTLYACGGLTLYPEFRLAWSSE